jgi:peptidoglycan/xylan/chitin deacetylase (PgdA/CDA1 family)
MQGIGNKYYELVSRLKGLRTDIAWGLGMGRSFARKARGGRIILFHGVCLRDHLQYNTLFISLRSLEAQIRLYKKYCNIISLEDHYQQRFDSNKFNLCLSFDDGFANNFNYVLPLLEKYEIPATFFITGIRDIGQDVLWNDVLAIAYKYGPQRITMMKEDIEKRSDGKYILRSTGELLVDKLRLTGYAEKEEMIKLLGDYRQQADPDFWLQMTAEQIKKLSASQWVTIGSHGYLHNDLAVIAADQLKEEMVRSKQYLENITGKEVKAIAFPYGSYNSETVKESKNAGYSQLLATDFLFSSDKDDTTMKERLTINPFITSINQLHANIRGKY